MKRKRLAEKLPKALVITTGIVAVLSLLTTVYAVYALSAAPSNERCGISDIIRRNCVPPGRCTPLGDPDEARVDCDIKKYARKYILN